MMTIYLIGAFTVASITATNEDTLIQKGSIAVAAIVAASTIFLVV